MMVRRTARAAEPARPPVAAVDGLALVLLVLALAAAVAAYAPGLSSPFVFDDERYVRDNPTLLRVWPPGWIHAGTQEIRPVTNLSFALDVAAFGTGPRGHHVVNLALHLATVVLLFALVKRLRPPAEAGRSPDRALAAATAAAILALHPAHSTSVLYIQGRPGLLSTAFAVGAVLVAAAAIRRREGSRHGTVLTVVTTALVALGALSKESGAAVPALILLGDATGVLGGERSGLRARLLRFHLPLWLALLPLALAYLTLQNPHGGVFGAGVVDAARFYATQPLVLLLYLRLYLWPSGLTVDRVVPLLAPDDPVAWGAAAAVLALLVMVVIAQRRAPWAGFWGAWWLAALAPTSLVPNREFVAERYLTMATPAVATLAAGALVLLAVWIARRRQAALRPLLVALVVLVALPLAWATRGRALVWRSDRALWTEATRVSPANPRAWYQYGRLLHADGETDAAGEAVRRSIALGGMDLQRALLLSDIVATQGDADSAIVLAGLAVGLGPQKPWTHVGLARALARRGRWAECRSAAGAALAIDSTTRAALYLRGCASAEQGDAAAAGVDAAALARLGHAEVEAAALRGRIAARRGSAAEADRWLARAVAASPTERDEAIAWLDAQRERAPLLLAAGRASEAIEAWTVYLDATGAGRWDTESLRGLQQARAQSGRAPQR